MENLELYFAKLEKIIREKIEDESGEVNVVAIVVLIAVAVVLALLFKKQIANLIKTMIELITGKAQTALDDVE